MCVRHVHTTTYFHMDLSVEADSRVRTIRVLFFRHFHSMPNDGRIGTEGKTIPKTIMPSKHYVPSRNIKNCE